MMRPSILIAAQPAPGLRTVQEVRDSIGSGHAADLWQGMLRKAQADLQAPPLTPDAAVPGRGALDAGKANPDYTICWEAGHRVLNSAMVALLAGREDCRYDALRQIECLLEESHWPQWRDLAHRRTPADLRTGMLAKCLALAYDWLHPMLTDRQRRMLVEGIDRRGIQPYLASLAARASWASARSNWTTCIVGGLGIAAMALGQDHPACEGILRHALPVMKDYLGVYGPKGEFNESVGYAGATEFPVMFFDAWRYWTAGRENLLGAAPFPQALRWYMSFCLPPGRLAAFGDGGVDSPPSVAMLAAVAGAARDGVLQGFYLRHCRVVPRRALCLELLWYDPSVEPLDPTGRLPLGQAFPAHGGILVSRSDWDRRSARCVVYGKAGHGAEMHGHLDAGQLCIDGCGQRLLVDLGRPSRYPADFFGPNRWQYYNAGAWGHNVLVFGDRGMCPGREHRSGILQAEFDDALGGSWRLDLTGMYQAATSVRRTVAHLLPDVVAVLDEAELPDSEAISLRWHTAAPCEPLPDGAFVVEAAPARLSAKVIRLDGPASFSLDRHGYRPPFDRGRLGEELDQRHEPFVHVRMHARRCRLLSLFAVFGPSEALQPWRGDDDGWTIQRPGGLVEVRLKPEVLSLSDGAKVLTVPMRDREQA